MCYITFTCKLFRSNPSHQAIGQSWCVGYSTESCQGMYNTCKFQGSSCGPTYVQILARTPDGLGLVACSRSLQKLDGTVPLTFKADFDVRGIRPNQVCLRFVQACMDASPDGIVFPLDAPPLQPAAERQASCLSLFLILSVILILSLASRILSLSLASLILSLELACLFSLELACAFSLVLCLPYSLSPCLSLILSLSLILAFCFVGKRQAQYRRLTSLMETTR